MGYLVVSLQLLLTIPPPAKQDWPDDLDVVSGRLTEAAMESASHQSLNKILPLLKSDGSFSDLKYEEGTSAFRTHGRRLSALMYHLLNGEDVVREVLSSFSFITYDAPPNKDTNPWCHLIGVPIRMWAAITLAKDLVGQPLLTDFLDRFWLNTPAGPVWNSEEHAEGMSGGNFGPRAMLAEVEGLLRGTHERVHIEVEEGLHRELVERRAFEGNGFRPDGCLHQHNIRGDYATQNGYLTHTLSNIYNAGYGRELLKFASYLMTWYTGTGIDFSADVVEGMFSAFLECQQWLFRGHTSEPTTTGRHLTDGSTITQYGTRGGIRTTGRNLQKMGRHLEEVEAALHRYDNVLPDPAYALVGNKYFFNSDLTVHQRRDYMASVRILSNRTTRPETWPPSENGDGYFQGDGFLTVLVDGEEYGKPKAEVFLVYDWAKVPGVTNLYTTEIPQYRSGPYWAEWFFNNETFAGGVTDGRVGVTAMASRRPHVPLRHLKSWFFFDDVIVALGSDIDLDETEETGKSVITTLAQLSYAGTYVVGTKCEEEVSPTWGTHKEDLPTWLHHRNIGYVFLNGDEKLFTSADTRVHSGSYIDIFTAWLNHGLTPKGASHAFAVLPAADLERTRAFAADPEVQVISHNRTLHAVCHRTTKTIGAAFVEAGEVVASCGDSGQLSLSVDVPCLALVTVSSESADAAELLITLADPQQSLDNVHLKISFDGRDAEQTVPLPTEPRKGSSVVIVITV